MFTCTKVVLTNLRDLVYFLCMGQIRSLFWQKQTHTEVSAASSLLIIIISPQLRLITVSMLCHMGMTNFLKFSLFSKCNFDVTAVSFVRERRVIVKGEIDIKKAWCLSKSLLPWVMDYASLNLSAGSNNKLRKPTKKSNMWRRDTSKELIKHLTIIK